MHCFKAFYVNLIIFLIMFHVFFFALFFCFCFCFCFCFWFFFPYRRIYQWAVNLNGTFYNDKSEELLFKIRKFFAEQDSWMRQMIRKHPKDPYWQMVSLVLAQFDGLLAGYNARPYQNKVRNRPTLKTPR